MKTVNKLFMFFLLWGFLSGLAAQEFSRIEITDDEINGELERVIKQNRLSGVEININEIPRLRENIREGILMRKILVSLARYRSMVITREEIDKALILTRGDYPPEEWLDLLLQQGYTEESFRAVLEDSLLVDRILEIEVLNHVRVTPEEVKTYYEEHREDFTNAYGIIPLSEVQELIKKNLLALKGQQEVSRFMDDLYARAMFIDRE